MYRNTASVLQKACFLLYKVTGDEVSAEEVDGDGADNKVLVHKRMYWIRMNLRMLQPSNVFVTFECLYYVT